MSVKLSHPDKVLWPKTAGTPAFAKKDLYDYYDKAAARILPHVIERPLSIVRAPDGIDGQKFFQRHVMEGIGNMAPVKVKGEAKPYMSIEGKDGLLQLAQIAALEFHPWGSKRGDPETPERLIFDLDPAPGMEFERVVDAAKQLRERLRACGLAPFLKTTGGKGLHVVTPIAGTSKRPATWEDARRFAADLCAGMEADEPDRYTTNMRKAARTNKVFLDYLRNAKSATAVAPWSPRARPSATVAVPIPWSKATAKLDPHRYTLASAAAFLRAADPWKEMGQAARALDAAAKRLKKM